MIGSPAMPPLDRHQEPRPGRPAPLAEWSAAARAGVRGLMTDIDDTLTRDGAIEPVALQALHALAAAGVPVVAITGRPAGWSEPFARAWPVRAIVAENGAVALVRQGDRLDIRFAQDAATRERNTARLRAVATQVLQQVPAARLAQDSAGRLTDIAIDHSEFASLPPDDVARVVAVMRAAGMTATVSSIHVNGWFGGHDKFSGAAWMARELFGEDLLQTLPHWAYVGDSTNDQVMFARFVHSVGVANLMQFAAVLHTWPAWITPGARGEGFAQVAQALLAARAA